MNPLISENVAADAVCIIGIGCRYPGEEGGVDGFWKTIVEARSTHSVLPDDRFDRDKFFHPSHDRGGSINTQGGYFLKDDVSHFDATFFSITAHEAAGMDPQQRFMLEMAYETFENAGISISQINGSNTGCYVGSFSNDYQESVCGDLYEIHPYTSTGTGRSMLANRVSWFYDLKGPSLTVDTACSSSMYALHLACQSLRLGETKMSLVGGSNLILSPMTMRSLASMRFLSPTGKCHSYDQSADGYARGEGVGLLLLKRLSDAIADGDTIRAVIRSSGVNQDGHTPGITLPSSAAQSALIRQCYSEAGISMDDTVYFEGHGTGTLQGDPLELSALGSTFGVTRTMDNPLVVGSVKANIGHQEGGAGVAGVIRAVLAVEKGIIPPTAELLNPNKAFKLDEWKIALSNKALPWPNNGPRRASINSFGYGGANSHVIIEDAYHYMLERGLKGNHNTCEVSSLDEDSDVDSAFHSPSMTPSLTDDMDERPIGKWLCAFSAFDQAALGRILPQYLSYLQQRLDASRQTNVDLLNTLSDLAYTLTNRRTVFPYRVAFSANSMTDLVDQIKSCPTPKAKKVPRKDNVAFVFTGQGAQYHRMGRNLLEYSAFRESLEQCQRILATLGCEWNIFEELEKDECDTQVHLPRFSQPLCTAVQIALVDLLACWQLHPKMVVGHSSGEIGAAYASGKLARGDCMTVAYHRGLFSSLVSTRQGTKHGAMLAVGLGHSEVQKFVSNINAKTPGAPSVVVACINSPRSVTLSGDLESIQSLEAELKAAEVFARMLKTSGTAYHSQHMECIAEDYYASMRALKPLSAGPRDAIMFSSTTGSIVPQFTKLDASYWVDNMLQPVKFAQAVHSMLNHSNNGRKRRRPGSEVTALVEIGPSNVLRGPIQQILAEEDPAIGTNVLYTSVLKRGEDADTSTINAMAALWERGTAIDINAVNQHLDGDRRPRLLVDLPAYKWNHSSRIWHEPTMNRQQSSLPRTDLLGHMHSWKNTNSPIWRNTIRLTETPWLADHKVFNAVLYPAASMIVMALEAAKKQAERGRTVQGYQFRDIGISKALIIPPDGRKVEVQMTLKPKKDGTRTQQSSWYEFSFVALDDQQQWNEHCFGQFKIIYESQVSDVDNGQQASMQWAEKKTTYEHLKDQLHHLIPKASFYKSVHRLGMNYGPSFQAVDHMYTSRDKCHGVIEIADTATVMPHGFEYPHSIHPVTLDGIFQTLFSFGWYDSDQASAQVPVNIGKLYIASELPSGAGNKFYGYGGASRKSDREVIGQIVMSDEGWSEPKVIIEDIALVSVGQIMAIQEHTSALRRKFSRLRWVPDLRHCSPSISKVHAATEDAFDTVSPNAVEMMRLTLDALRDEQLHSGHWQNFFDWTSHALLEVPHTSHPICIPEALTTFPEGVRTLVAEEDGSFEALRHRAISALVAETDDPTHASDFSALDDWLQTIYLSNPDAAVLLLGDGSPCSAACHVAKKHVMRAGHADSFRNSILTEIDQYFVARTKEALDGVKAQMKFVAFDPIEDAAISEVDLQSFDVIVAPPNLAYMASALQNVVRLLAPTGTLLFSGKMRSLTPFNFISSLSEKWWSANMAFLTRTSTETDSEQMLLRLQKLGLVKRGDICKRGDRVTFATVPKQHAEWDLNRTLANRRFVLIQPTNDFAECHATKFQNLLNKRLRLAGCSVSTARLGDQDAVKDQTVVCLVELFEDLVANMSEETLISLRDLTAAASQLVWLSRGAVHGIDGQSLTEVNPDQSLTTGLFRSVRSEIPRLTTVHVDLSSSTDITSQQTVELVTRTLAHELFRMQGTSSDGVADHDRELAIHGGKVFVPRVVWDESFNQEAALAQKAENLVQVPLYQPDIALRCAVGLPGRLDSLHWVQHKLGPLQDPLVDNEVWIKVSAWSLNFMDIMAAMGQIPTTALGVELAGEVVACGPNVTRLRPGMRIVTPARPGFVSHFRHPESDNMMEIPAQMDMATAASFPVIYTTAYLALVTHGRLRRGESVLIHAAAGGVGQAALQLAKWLGAEIYATVGSNAKKQLLIDHYGIPAERIFSSRDLSFAPGIMRATRGRGIDVILNCLAGEALRETWNCIATFGRFIEIGKRDILANNALDMSHFLRHISFTSVNLEMLDDLNPAAFTEAWTEVWNLVLQNIIGPVYPINKFHVDDSEKAFRLVAGGAHSGKVVITPYDIDRITPREQVIARDDSEVDKPLVQFKPSKKKTNVELDPTASYVLCGGLGGVGRTTALMMAKNGAKHLIFLSRSGATKHQQHSLLRDLEDAGVRTTVLLCDAGDSAAVTSFVTLCDEKQWRVKGVVQCAMVLRDRMFENMSLEEWQVTTDAKVKGTKNLSDALPADLDFFIMLSSISGVIGNPGQSNYNAANTYLDALAQWRRSQGMPAVTIDLGVLADSGYFSENQATFEMYAPMAVLHISDSELRMLLSAAMNGRTTDGQPVPSQIIAGMGKEYLLTGTGKGDNKFLHVMCADEASGVNDDDATALREAVSSSTSIRNAAHEIKESLLQRLGKSLMMDATDIDASQPLHAYGVDSLVAIDIRNWVFRELAADITVFDIISPMPISLLSLRIASVSGLVPKNVIAESIEEVTKELNAAMPASL